MFSCLRGDRLERLSKPRDFSLRQNEKNPVIIFHFLIIHNSHSKFCPRHSNPKWVEMAQFAVGKPQRSSDGGFENFVLLSVPLIPLITLIFRFIPRHVWNYIYHLHVPHDPILYFCTCKSILLRRYWPCNRIIFFLNLLVCSMLHTLNIVIFYLSICDYPLYSSFLVWRFVARHLRLYTKHFQ